jgi:outer membrane immunogenic protein
MRTLLALFLISSALPLAAQKPKPAKFEISTGYAYVHSNAPPGECGCFSLNGGSAALSYNLAHHVSVAGDIAVVHNSNVDASGTALTLTSYTFGPQYSVSMKRLSPYGHVLLGGAYEVKGQGNSSAFAMTLGGGLDLSLSHRWSWRLVQADYYLTHFGNSANSRQNNLRLGTGVVFRF